jgi:hypothetical protein
MKSRVKYMVSWMILGLIAGLLTFAGPFVLGMVLMATRSQDGRRGKNAIPLLLGVIPAALGVLASSLWSIRWDWDTALLNVAIFAGVAGFLWYTEKFDRKVGQRA